MKRYELNREHWYRIEPFIPGKIGDRGRHGVDNLLFITVFCGFYALVRIGMTCLSGMASGKLLTNALRGGRRQGFGKRYSMC